MNLFSVFTLSNHHPTGEIVRMVDGEFQMFWRGDETDNSQVKESLSKIGINDVTFVERLK